MPLDAGALQGRIVAWLQEHVAAVRRRTETEATQDPRAHRDRHGDRRADRVAASRSAGGEYRPLALALANRAERFGEAFRRVVFAQVRIAAVNAVLTALYLSFVILPLLGGPPPAREDG